MKKLLSLLVAGLLALGITVSAAPAELAPNPAPSSAYKLEVGDNCTVSVKDEQGNTLWVSNPNPDPDSVEGPLYNNMMSQLVVTYFNEEQKQAVIGSYLASINRDTADVKEISGGYRITYNFSRKQEQFTIPVEYTLNNDVLSVEVITSEISERSTSYISKIALLPYALMGTPDEEGWLLIPDGSGALIDFAASGNSTEYSARVFGRDLALAYNFDEGNKNTVYLPVFGRSGQESACLAVIEGNAESAEIVAERQSERFVRVGALFIYREYDTALISGTNWNYNEYPVTADTTVTGNFKVNFHLLPGGSDYVDLATTYRDYLVKNNSLTPANEADNYSLGIKAYGATTQKASFLGIPYRKNVKVTTFDDLNTLAEKLNSAGAASTAYILKDFATRGSVKAYPSSVKIASFLGGKKGLDALADTNGGGIFAEYDLMFERVNGLLFLKEKHLATKLSKDFVVRSSYHPVTYAEIKNSNVYGIKVDTLEQKAAKFLKKVAGQRSLGVALAGFGNSLYSDFNDKQTLRRDVQRTAIEDLLKNFGQKDKTASQGGNIYTALLSGLVYDIPVTSSHFDIESKSVPFYQTVLKGYVNMLSDPVNLFADTNEQLLLCVDSGTVPTFAVTGRENSRLIKTDYNTLYNTYIGTLSDTILTHAPRLEAINKATAGATVKAKITRGSLSVTEYDNGVRVLVNFGGAPAVYEGVLVQPKDYTYIK